MTNLPPPPVPGPGAYGVGPYATSSMPMPPMRSLRGLWIALLVLFALVAVADIVAAGAFFNRADLLEGIDRGEGLTFQQALEADDGVQNGLALHALLAVAIIVVFIIWQFRHAKNAQALGDRGGLGPGWAIGGWFIPVANWVLPGLQILQASRASDPRVGASPGTRAKGAPVVVVWMVLLALASLLFLAGGGLRSADEDGNVSLDTPDERADAASGDQSAGAAMVLYVGAAIAGGIMVRSLSTRQTIAYEARLAGATPAPFGSGPYGGPPPGAPAAPVPPGQWGAAPPSWSQPAAPPAPPAPPGTPPAPPTQWGTPPP